MDALQAGASDEIGFIDFMRWVFGVRRFHRRSVYVAAVNAVIMMRGHFFRSLCSRASMEWMHSKSMHSSLFKFFWIHAKLLAKTIREIGEVVKSHLIGDFRNAARFLTNELGDAFEPDASDEFRGRESGEAAQFAVQHGATDR